MIMCEVPWLINVKISNWVNIDYKVNYQMVMYYRN